MSSIINNAAVHKINGIKEMDALHLACAAAGRADYFITTDNKLLKYRTGAIKIINPYDFLNLWMQGDSNE